MISGEILLQGAAEVAGRVRSGALDAEDVLDAHLRRIADQDSTLHAFLSVAEEGARTKARRVDRCVREGGDPGPLAGVVIAVKDNILTRGLKTTCGSRILADFTPVYDATVVRRIEDAGAVVIGKTNLDEFAFGSSTENSAFGPTRNPWNVGCVPGGSSGGSAAAVASGMATLALGSDTGGSVRQPGGFCGLVALKPHYGHVSRWGLVAFASSFDVIGPLARDAADCALLWNVIRGHDPRDATTLPTPDPIDLDALDDPIRGVRLGIPSGWLGPGCDAEVKDALYEAVRVFRDAGAKVEEVELPDPRYAISVYYVVASAEASSNLARFDGIRYGSRNAEAADLEALYELSRGLGFGPEAKRRILMGTFVLSSGYYEAYYLKAQRVRQLLREKLTASLREADALLLPTSPTPAFRLGEKTQDPLAMYLSDVYTVLPNLVHIPAVSFPAGTNGRGLPLGLQLYGRPREEAMLLRLVRAHERATDGTGSVRGGRGPVAHPGPIGDS